MADKPAERPKRRWLGLVITTLLGIAATVGVGWYQLTQAEKQALAAEEERARTVRESLVSIVEEHVLNDKPIEAPRLARLIDQKRREERVTTPITAAEILEKAEFNVLGSRYLAFERKQALKAVFDTLYAELSTRSFAPYKSEELNSELLNSLAREIRDGKTTEALQTLRRLQEAHIRDLQEARSSVRRPSILPDALGALARDPLPLLITVVVYLLLLLFLMSQRREIRRFIRRFLGPRLSPSEARDRIAHYRRLGMPYEMIAERLWDLGAPRAWVLRELSKKEAEMPDETTSEATPEQKSG